MRFVLRMALRETRAAWRRLIFFFLCLAIGVGSIVTLRSVVQAVRDTLRREARTILGADLAISTNRPWDASVLAQINARLATVRILQRLEETETLSMVRPADPSKAVARLVELHGIQAGFPLYGRITLDGGVTYSHELLRGRGVVVRPELLVQLGVGVGDDLVIGEQRFTIRGVVTAEPGRGTGAFSFGSRVFVDLDDLAGTGLLTFGSRASHRILLRIADTNADAVARELRRAFTGQFVSFRSYQSAEDRTGDTLQRTEDYLSLVGLVIVVLGGVGVWSVVRVFIQQKLKSIAVLKCVGATSRQVLSIYVAQVMAMGFIGSLAGVILAGGALVWLKPTIDRTAGFETPFLLSGSAVTQGMGVGLLVSLLFALVPLLDVRHVRPSLLLRASDPPAAGGRDWARLGAVAIVGTALVALAAWQAGSVRIGLVLSVGFTAAGLVLHGAGWVLVKAITPLQSSGRFAVRYAARRVTRPGNQTRAILLAVGLGAFLMVGVRTLQANLLQEFQLELRPDTPDIFLIDVQPDQVEPLRAFLGAATSRLRGPAMFIPVLRARVTGVKGKSLNLDRYEDVRGRGSLGREYVVTYRGRLQRNERLVDGRFWPDSPSDVAEVSIEEGLRTRVGISLGDMVRFDVLGRVIEARVTSVRAVEWADASAGGFMFVFRPGVLDGAPRTFIVPMRGPAGAVARARLQRDLTARFPNVSAIDVEEVLASVASVIGSVTLAVTVVGALVLFSGILILVGSISMTKFQRVYEVAVLKTLGATTPLVAALLVIEYGLLGLVAGAIGSVGAMTLSWGVSRFVLDVAWHPRPILVTAGLVGSVVLVAGVGLAASVDVLRRKPLGTLRAE
jgi:putative ABC transport system permease protein